ncbi:MAG: hypothetical protein WAO28_00270 [Candidatus Microsaccharimonas sp.]
MKALKLIGYFVIVISLSAGVIFFLWIIAKAGWDAYRTLTEGVQVTILAGLVTLFTTLFSITYSKVKEKKLQIEANNNTHKQKLYSDFTGKVVDLLSTPELGDNDEWTKDMRLNFMKNAFLWSDSRVLKAYQRFRINSQIDGEGEQAIYDIATLMLEFRKDLGLKNKKITQHTIVDILYDQSDLVNFYRKYPEKR